MIRSRSLALALAVASALVVGAAPPRATPFPSRVADDHRTLLDPTGRPFFYLGDTAWELFHRLDDAEAEVYLRDRASKGFNVIQAVVLAEYGGLTQPDRGGHLPLVGNDPTKPIEAYFAHVDKVVALADSLGLVVGMLPTWGDKWNTKWGQGPEIFTPANAEAYGEFLANRYRDRPIVWILGGDRSAETDAHRAIIRAMAAGLAKGDGGRHLITFHPMGGRSSSEHFQADPWLAFDMIQSGHDYNTDNGARILADLGKLPAKPCLDGEPGYEDHPAGFKAANGYLDDHDARKAAYWALLAGAAGHTYGCHDIWQFLSPGNPAVTSARTPWTAAIHLPGAGQMKHARALIESRPMLGRAAFPELLASPVGSGGDRLAALRGADSSFALVYSPAGKPFAIDPSRLPAAKLVATWYDPRDGSTRPAGTVDRESRRFEFRPPSAGKGRDWVLVIDDEARAFPPPGRAASGR